MRKEDDNIHDENSVAVIHSNHIGPRVVGHVPFMYSSTFKKFLSLPNHTIRVLVTGKKNLNKIDSDISKRVGRCLK